MAEARERLLSVSEQEVKTGDGSTIGEECHQILKSLKYVLVFSWFCLISLYGVGLMLVWMVLLLPLRVVLPKLHWTIAEYLSCAMEIMATSPLRLAGFQVYDAGDDVTELGNDVCLLLLNRPGYVDPVLLMQNMYNKSSSSRSATWIHKTPLKWSHIGLLGLLRGDFVLNKHSNADTMLNNVKLQLHLLKSVRQRQKKWIILFPEGGLLLKHRPASREFAKEHGFPVLNNVLLPRVSETHQVLTTLTGGDLKWVVDVTVAYKKNPPRSFSSFFNGKTSACDVIFYHKIYPVGQIPHGEDQLRDWLYKRYQEKDLLLENFCHTGIFPKDDRTLFVQDSRDSNLMDKSSTNLPSSVPRKIPWPSMVLSVVLHALHIGAFVLLMSALIEFLDDVRRKIAYY